MPIGSPIIICSDELMCDQLTMCLGGFSISLTNKGKDVLNMLADSPPNLLVLENNLPDMTGLSLLKIVKISYPHVPIIFIYDSHNPTLAISAFQFGARDCFVKPVDNEILRKKVGLLLNTTKNSSSIEGNIFLDRYAHLDSVEQEFLQEVLFGRKEGVYQAKRFLDRNFSQNITLEQLAETACMSKYHFSRLFKRRMGISWTQHLSGLRIEKAKQLLVDGDMSVTEVCDAVGYNDLTHFARVFKKHVGVTPRAYRKKIIKTNNSSEIIGYQYQPQQSLYPAKGIC